jgi:hypothetical protein
MQQYEKITVICFCAARKVCQSRKKARGGQVFLPYHIRFPPVANCEIIYKVIKFFTGEKLWGSVAD